MANVSFRADKLGRRVFQIAYYSALLETRSVLLQNAGYAVSSVMGNEQAKAAADDLAVNTDVVLIGFSGPYDQRMAMLRWLKERYPNIPVMVMQAQSSEVFTGADAVAQSDHPESWVAALHTLVQQGG